MGMSLDTLVLKLRATTFYPALFAGAFGTPQITSDRISRALAQYIRSFVSGNSRYDRAVRGEAATVLTSQEQQGEQLFRTAGCAQCHTTVAQISDGAHNVGLDATNVDVGTGRGAVKVPSLRNVAARPRYMHDGRLTSLEQVIDFFDSGVQANPDLDPRLKGPDGSPRRLGLTLDQKASLVAFLKTLTDSTFLTDVRFSDPFASVAVAPPSNPGPTPSPTPGPPPSAPPPTNVAITIQGNAYHPALQTVAPGATIAFTNADNRRHSASFFSSAIVSTPIFTSGTQTVKMPTAPGTYGFQCAVHGAAMSGTIIVQ
jgi:plastocyanin